MMHKSRIKIGNPVMRSIYGRFSWNVVWLLIYAIGVGLFLIGMPKFCDDYWYMLRLKSWFDIQGIINPDSGGDIFKWGIPWQDIWDTCVDHYHTDNGRIGNMIVPFFLLLPKWIGSGLVTVIWLYAVVGSLHLSGISWRRSSVLPIALALFWFMMPWGDHMGSLVFQFNYVFATGVAVFFLKRVRNYSQGFSHNLIVLIAGVLCGAWQEAISIPVLMGMTGIVILFNKYRNLTVFIGITGLLAGLIWLYLSPGLWSWGDMGNTAGNLSGQFIIKGAIHRLIFPIFQVLLLFVLLNRKKVASRSKEVLSFLEIVSITSFILYVLMGLSLRVGWIGCLASSVGCVKLLVIIFPQLRSGYGNLTVKILSGIVLAVIFSSQLMTGIVSLRIKDSVDTLISKAVISPDSVFFGKNYPVSDFPIITMTFPDDRFPTEGTRFMKDYITGNNETTKALQKDGADLRYVPEALAFVTADAGEMLEGGEGFRLKDGFLFVARDSIRDFHTMMDLDLDFGKEWVRAPVYGIEYISKSDGKKYVYYHIYSSWAGAHFKRLRGVRN